MANGCLGRAVLRGEAEVRCGMKFSQDRGLAAWLSNTGSVGRK